ncbi:hypothetical protein D3C75_442140 [compost metagenome]
MKTLLTLEVIKFKYNQSLVSFALMAAYFCILYLSLSYEHAPVLRTLYGQVLH